MKMRRLLLFILVAANLTVVCQGHMAGSGHTGVHLALLGESHAEDEPENARGAVQIPHAEDTLEAAHEVKSSALRPEAAGRDTDPALLAANHFSSLSTLAVALLGSIAGATSLFAMSFATPLTWTSRFRKPPEPPPPQARV
jgi:cellobiose-specific phosphotransferase system component IIA